MALDLSQTLPQLEALAGQADKARDDRERRLAQALQALRYAQGPTLNARAQDSQGLTFFLPAGFAEEKWQAYPPPPLPGEFAVLAVDGSHIDVDRHLPLRCYLINIGWALLRYGPHPDARLSSRPALYGAAEDLYITDGVEQVPVEGGLLNLKRTVEEARALASLAREAPEGLSALALLDGSLVLWELAGQPPPSGRYPAFVRRAVLEEGFLPALDALRRISSRPMAVAGYISLPNSSEVVSALRLALCPYPRADCRRHCNHLRPGQRPCDSVHGLVDRHLFQRLLAPGERSPLFFTRSSIVRDYYREHMVYFFYLNIGEEIARVEVPQWVAQEPQLLGLVHTLAVDQAMRKGQGYPAALQEAHEQAVVTARDREEFRDLVERTLLGRRLPVYTSEKRRSKRTRGV